MFLKVFEVSMGYVYRKQYTLANLKLLQLFEPFYLFFSKNAIFWLYLIRTLELKMEMKALFRTPKKVVLVQQFL